MMGSALILAYVGTIPAANWMVMHVGAACVLSGPCLIPVAPGLMAPSGVLMIGSALLLRDLIQRRLGLAASVGCIAVGSVLSLLIAPPAIALASAAAFLLSELADCAVYTPLWRRQMALAVVASCAAGAVIDSAAFLLLAFGNLDHLLGQIVGKLYAAAGFALWRTACADPRGS